MNTTEIPEHEQPDLFDLLRSNDQDAPPPVPSEPDTSDETDPAVSESKTVADQATPEAMPPMARRAMVALLRHGVIMASGKRLLFEAICLHQKKIQAHLANMYLTMLLDEQAGLAILWQQDISEIEDEEEISNLISRRTLTLYDTLLILVLRKHYQDRETAGEHRVIIDSEQIEVALRPFLPLTNNSRSDRRQLNGALKNMKDRRIITAVRGEDDRFEITAVIRYVVNASFLETLLSEYQQLAAQTEKPVTDGHTDD